MAGKHVRDAARHFVVVAYGQDSTASMLNYG